MTETWQQSRDRKRLDAARRLEELVALAQQMVLDLRGAGDSQEDADLTAYGRVYWLRKQVGYIVSDLGHGAPDTWVTKVVEKEYGTLATRNERVRVLGEGVKS